MGYTAGVVPPLHRRLLPLLLVAVSLSCNKEMSSPETGAPVRPPHGAPPPVIPAEAAPQGDPEPPLPEDGKPLVRCHPDDGPLIFRSLEELEERALAAEKAGDPERMLACADEALRVAEDDVAAAHLRAEALALLGRYEEARDAFTLALALSPDDPWILAGAADLYVNHLPQTRQNGWIARSWTERALAVAARMDPALSGRLHLLAAWALADLGDFRHSAIHATAALEWMPDARDPLVAKGRALFELTRFEGAVAVLRKAIERWPDDAEAHHLLGLNLERIPGRLAEAEVHLARATELDPVAFPGPVALDPAAFEALVQEEIAALPDDERSLLGEGRTPVRIEAFPDLADLRAEVPPLSPTAVGMFRGPPLGLEEATGPREILLFARNLSRSATSLGDLRRQVRITLRHEVGHLRGEDEASLRARGLE